MLARSRLRHYGGTLKGGAKKQAPANNSEEIGRMDDRFNTIAGWALFAGIIALGGGIVSSKLFHQERPEKMGYAIEGVEAEGGEGAVAGPSLNTLLASADVAAGEKVFAKCAACHTIAAGGANGIGPNLHEIVGDKQAEGRGGFAFSDALKKKGGSWTFDALNAWLTSPREYAPGTKMTFAGLGNPVDRANLIAYLNTQGSNLPLPAADAAPAAGGENAAAGAANATDNAAAPAEGANAAK
jgi:cytochrome c